MVKSDVMRLETKNNEAATMLKDSRGRTVTRKVK